VLVTKNLTNSTSNFNLFGLDLISQGDASSSARQYFLPDGQGNTRYITSNTGATVTSYSYEPFGKQTAGNSTTTPYTFQTEQKDSESGLTFLRARSYDPTTARFTAQDPLNGVLGDTTTQNGYNYANNNPINLKDPLGLAAQCGYGGLTPNATTSQLLTFKTTHPILGDLSKLPRGGSSSASRPTGGQGFNWVQAGDSAYGYYKAGALAMGAIGCGASAGAAVAGVISAPGAGAACMIGGMVLAPVGGALGAGIGFLIGGLGLPGAHAMDWGPDQLMAPW